MNSMVAFPNERPLFSFLLGFLLEPQFLDQLANVVLKVLLRLFQKAELEKHFVVHEEWGEDERYQQGLLRFAFLTTEKKCTSEHVIQKSGGAALVDAMSIELS